MPKRLSDSCPCCILVTAADNAESELTARFLREPSHDVFI